MVLFQDTMEYYAIMKIKLTNTSIHFSDCPECFEWSISGSPSDVIIDAESGSITFGYTEDVFNESWNLIYTESDNLCQIYILFKRVLM